MVSVVALPMLLMGLFALMPGLNGSDDTEDLPADPVDPGTPVDPATLGATFEAGPDSIDITFGENETGRLAVVTYVDTQDNPDYFIGIHEARYYLVPEGGEWPDNT